MATIRKAIGQLDEELGVFCTSLAQEVHELRRNVEHRPVTGATLYRRCLEDLNERLGWLGEEAQALEAVTLDAAPVQELVGHCVRVYQEQHRCIAALEARLQQYGYSEFYAPLPPEDPLDLLELMAARQGHRPATAPDAAAAGDEPALEEEPGCAEYGELEACEPEQQPMGDVTARLANSALPDAAGAGIRPAVAAKDGAPPATGAKLAARRDDTPSSLASPDFMSPSMRALVGKYAASSVGGSDRGPSEPAPTPGGPAAASGLTPLAPLSPAFAAAAVHQSHQLAAAAAGADPHVPAPSVCLGPNVTASRGEREGQTPEGSLPPASGSGWPRGSEVHDALTATARKLHERPSFLDAYRQRFPHIVASTERLLASVERQGGARLAGAGGLGTVGGPGGTAQHAGLGGREAGQADEESTMELYAQVISSRGLPGDLGAASAAPTPRLAAAAELHAAHGGSASRGRPELEGAIAAALGHAPAVAAAAEPAASHAAWQAPAPLAVPPPARPGHGLAAALDLPSPGVIVAAPVADFAAQAASGGARLVTEEEFEALPSFIRGQLPLARLNAALAAVHAAVAARAANDGTAQCGNSAAPEGGFSLEDVEAAGLGGRAKTFVNSLVKLGRARLRVVPGQGTTYLLQ